jgi:hypothetical protein
MGFGVDFAISSQTLLAEPNKSTLKVQSVTKAGAEREHV